MNYPPELIEKAANHLHQNTGEYEDLCREHVRLVLEAIEMERWKLVKDTSWKSMGDVLNELYTVETSWDARQFLDKAKLEMLEVWAANLCYALDRYVPEQLGGDAGQRMREVFAGEMDQEELNAVALRGWSRW